MDKTTTFYVTTPIYYVNDKPHIGHAYTTILADVLARYHRLAGDATWFLTGTDEHGQKVQRAAEKAGMTAQQQADATVVHFQNLWKRLDVRHDDFIRTTEARHIQVVQACLQDLFDRGEIYRAEYDGWYDVASETFVTEKDLPEGKRPEDLPNIVRIKEANYFFKMSKYQDWLIGYIQANPEFIQPDFRRNETLGFLRKPLQDLCISRPKTRLAWGITLPFDKDYVCYVWFDALVNYISAIGYGTDTATFSRWWPGVHLIGKDILTTHTVYWPTMLQAMGLPQPRTIFAHGWWLFGDAKMSKSLGNVVNPMDMAEHYGADAFRYFLMAEMIPGQDASFVEDGFVRRYNADLANDLGNLLNRVTNMTRRFCGGKVPALPAGALDGEAAAVRETVLQAVSDMFTHVNGFRIDLGLAAVLNAVKRVNKYFEVMQPWTLAKQTDPLALHTCLAVAAEAVRIIGQLLQPVMPEKMAALRAALGLAGDQAHAAWREFGNVLEGCDVQEPGGLFPRIERASEQAPTAEPRAKNRVTASASVPVAAAEGLITFDDFKRVVLRAARIVSAEKVEGADKLLKLQVEVGGEMRQVVAGIAQHYRPEDLPGRTVALVANLKPATIRGISSQGMLLAASEGDVLRLVTIDGDIASGTVIR